MWICCVQDVNSQKDRRKNWIIFIGGRWRWWSEAVRCQGVTKWTIWFSRFSSKASGCGGLKFRMLTDRWKVSAKYKKPHLLLVATFLFFIFGPTQERSSRNLFLLTVIFYLTCARREVKSKKKKILGTISETSPVVLLSKF